MNDAATTNSKRKRLFMGLAAAGVVLLLAIAVVVTLIARDSGNDKTATVVAAPTAVVQITAGGFVPATLSVLPGTKVIWTNGEEALHQVASNPHPDHTDLAGLYSPILNDTQTFEYTFSDTGSFNYHDEQNPTLNGTVNVEAR